MVEPFAVTLPCQKCGGSGRIKSQRRRLCSMCRGKGFLRVLTPQGKDLLEFLYEFLDTDLLKERSNHD